MTLTTLSEAGVEQVVPLLTVKSMEASLRFYVDGLGFKITNKWIDEGVLRWCWLQLGGASLMLQEFKPDPRNARSTLGPVGGGVGVNFICRDALAYYHHIKTVGLEAGRPFVGNNMWVTSIVDPDGYSLHFESPTEVPEETVYDY